MKELYEENKSREDWQAAIKHSREYRKLSRGCKAEVLDEVLNLLSQRRRQRYGESRNASSAQKAYTPLALACEIAARELGIHSKDGQYYSATTLLKKYRQSGL
jgi:hypothetical protein